MEWWNAPRRVVGGLALLYLLAVLGYDSVRTRKTSFLKLKYIYIYTYMYTFSFFYFSEDAQGEGGHGGAIYTTATGITTFRRKANFRNNRGGTKGGAVHSAGITTLQRSAVFSGNMASVRERPLKRVCVCVCVCVFSVTKLTIILSG